MEQEGSKPAPMEAVEAQPPQPSLPRIICTQPQCKPEVVTPNPRVADLQWEVKAISPVSSSAVTTPSRLKRIYKVGSSPQV